jgi:ABC-type uncharacterized transport system permease subunit
VNAGLLTALIGLGAAAIALWIDARFPSLAPQELAKAALHIAASVVAGYATGPAVQALAAADDPRVVLFGVFAVAFPSVVYCFLAGIWMIKLVQRMMSGYLH